MQCQKSEEQAGKEAEVKVCNDNHRYNLMYYNIRFYGLLQEIIVACNHL